MEKEQSIMNVAGKYGEYSIKDGEIVFAWPDTVSISREDLWKEIDADWEVWKAQEYARKRQADYPSIKDVTVALAEKIEGSGAMWDEITTKRTAVKKKYPKP